MSHIYENVVPMDDMTFALLAFGLKYGVHLEFHIEELYGGTKGSLKAFRELCFTLFSFPMYL